MLLAERKQQPRRSGGGAENQLSEIEKERGFDRNLELEAIVGAATDPKNGSRRMFLIKWHGCDELDLLPASEVNERCPETVIEFYQSRSPVWLKCERRRLVAEQAAHDAIEYPAVDEPRAEPAAMDADAEEEEGAAASPSATGKLTLEALVAEVVAPAGDEADQSAEFADAAAAAAAAEEATTATAAEAADEVANTTGGEATAPPTTTAESSASSSSVIRLAGSGAQTPTMDEDPNDSFLSEVASEAAQHQARTEALPEDIAMPDVDF